ncbi:MAG: DUF1552 domain-containing protein [Myxococcales bacterium]|nr:DUF1552 domain-containing protein [Myxococcales bacterium]
MTRHTRRDFVRMMGLGAGASFLVPMLNKLVGEGTAQAQPRRRVIFFVDSCGLLPALYAPKSGFELGGILAPLAPYRDEVLILDKFHMHREDNHGSGYATLTGVAGKPGGASMDRVLARSLGKTDPVSSTAFGTLGGENKQVVCVSADGPNQPFPAEWSPNKIYQTLFAGRTGTAAQPDLGQQLLSSKRSALDFLVQDVQRASSRLAGPERAKLDQYLESLREIERRLAASGSLKCDTVKAPAKPESAYRQRNDEFPSEAVPPLLDLTFAAHLCSLTHVSLISIEGYNGAGSGYGFLGIKGSIHHQMHHFSMMPELTKAYTQHAAWLASLVGKFKATAEGGGTMADNTVFVWVNAAGGIHHEGTQTHPAILIGGKGYFRGGRYLQYPDKKHALSDVLISVANFAGLPIEKFGDISTGPLPDLRVS